MNRKHNPWAALVALILLAVVLVMTCTGCGVKAEAAETETAKTGGSRFEVELESWGFPFLDGIYIVTDNQTGMKYLFCVHPNGAGLTKLEE